SRRRHTRFSRDWSSDVCSSDLPRAGALLPILREGAGVAGRWIFLVEVLDDRARLGEPEVAVAQGRHPPGDRPVAVLVGVVLAGRSEERRVGKECRGVWTAGPTQ